MDIEDITKQIESGEAVLLDVREQDEWDEGHIKGAQHIPLGKLSSETTRGFSQELPVYVYCRSGGRATRAEAVLRTLGFSKAKNIGGIIQWQEAGGELI